MRHSCLFLLLTIPAAGTFSSAAAADDMPVLIRAQEPVVIPAQAPELPPRIEANQVRPRGRMLGASIYGSDRLAQVVGDELVIPPLIAPTTDQSRIGNSQLPEDTGREALNDLIPLPEGPDRGPDWSLTAYLWQAPNTWSGPLYFEDVMLERHGHERFPHYLQPLASAARFYATIPALPYLMAVRPPGECYYHMGYYRVGSCAPPLLQRPPYERRAAIITAGVVGGAVALP